MLRSPTGFHFASPPGSAPPSPPPPPRSATPRSIFAPCIAAVTRRRVRPNRRDTADRVRSVAHGSIRRIRFRQQICLGSGVSKASGVKGEFVRNENISAIVNLNFDVLLRTYMMVRYRPHLLRTIERPDAPIGRKKIPTYHAHEATQLAHERIGVRTIWLKDWADLPEFLGALYAQDGSDWGNVYKPRR